MKTITKVTILFFVFFFSCESLFARNTVTLSDEMFYANGIQSEPVSLSQKLWYLYLSKDMNYGEVLQRNNFFVPSREISFLGYRDDSVWVRFRITNESNKKNWILYSKFVLLDYIELFDSSENSSYIAGDKVVNAEQRFSTHLPFFHLEIEPNTTRLFYMRIKTNGIFLIDFNLQEEESFFQAQSKHNFFYGLYFGILLGFVFFVLMFFLLRKQKQFLYLFLFFFSFFWLMFILEGYAKLYVPFPFLIEIIFLLLIPITILFWLLFFSETFALKEKFPKVYVVFYFLQAIALFLIVPVFFKRHFVTDIFSVGLIFLSIPFLFFVLLRYFLEERELRISTIYFVSSILFLSSAAILHVFWHYRILPSFFLTEYVLEIFSNIGFVLLIVALILKEKYVVQGQIEKKAIALEEIEDERKKQNKQLHQYEDDIERTETMSRFLQQQILSEKFSTDSRIAIEPSFLSVDKPSGDFYNMHKFSDTRYRFFLADTVGEGTQAVLSSLAIKTEYENLQNKTDNLSTLMNKLNENFIKKFSHLNIFFTGILLEINLKTNKLCYVSAGHPDQIVMQNNQTFFLRHSGRIAGFSSHLTYKQHEIDIAEQHTRIFLFSKSLLQEQNQETYPETHLYEQFDSLSQHSLKHVVRFVLEDLKKIQEQKKLQKDITLIGIEIEPVVFKEDHDENIFTVS